MERLLGYLHGLLAPHGGDCARRLREELEAVRAGASRRPAANVPGCSHLRAALAGTDAKAHEAISGVEGALAWRRPGFGRLPEILAAQMAVVELVGPGGMVPHDEVSLGLILIGPRVDYPSHSHAAEELYLVLSGELDWWIDGQGRGPIRKGDAVLHKPWQRHAMSTGAAPALLFWGWAGDIRGETYMMAT